MMLSGKQDQGDPGVTLHRATPQFTILDKPDSSFFLFLFRHGHREFRKSLQRPHTRLRLRAKGTAKKSGPARIANFVRRVNAKIVLCQPHLWRCAKSNDDVVEISSERPIIRLAHLWTKAYVTRRQQGCSTQLGFG